MSNLVVIIANAYHEFDKNYNDYTHVIEKQNIKTFLNKHLPFLIKPLSFLIKHLPFLNKHLPFLIKHLYNIIFILITILYVFLNILTIFNQKSNITTIITTIIITTIVYFLAVFAIRACQFHYMSQKCRKRFDDYKIKISNFYYILRNDYSIDSKDKLLYLIEQCKVTQTKLKYNLDLIKLLPVIGTFFAILVSLKDLTLKIVLLLVFALIIILYFGWLIQTVVNHFFNYVPNRLKTLEYILTDIYYIYFINKR